ncbi:MAG: VPLPA-CTERM sorting domain-containing protein [Aliishimia sp.]
MNRTLNVAALLAFFATNMAHAAPIGAFSELEMSHSFVINSGNIPAGIGTSNPGNSFEFDAEATSSVDDPTGDPSQTNFVQVGNPFLDPPLPFVSQRNNATQLPGGFEGAAGGYAIEVTTEDDPRDDVFDITRRSVAQEGSASSILLDETIASAASSFVRSSRDYRFTNTTDQLISFNIAGQFDAMLRAEYTGNDGLARVAAGFELDFVGNDGVEINYFPVAPYLTMIEDSDPGSFVSHGLQTFSGGATDLIFNAAASASGSGGTTLASFEGQHRYVFGLTLGPSATVLLRTSYTQANSVEHTPLGVAAVPLPAGGLLLITGLFSLAMTRRRRS